MEDVLTICPRCSWIHVDGAGEFCNGCGARHGSAGPVVAMRPMPRPLVADLIPATLLLTLFALILAAAR